MKLKMTKTELQAFISANFPQTEDLYFVQDVAPMAVTLRLAVTSQHLRPGNTVSGPSIFGLADVAMYVAVLAMIGPVALAVTTNCSVDFMRKPAAGADLIAKARILKLGRHLVVGDVMIYSCGHDAPVARASVTYSIPPERQPEA